MGWREYQTVIATEPFDQEKGRAMIKELIADLNQYQWPGNVPLPPFTEIDVAFLTGDMASLKTSLSSYKQQAIDLLNKESSHG